VLAAAIPLAAQAQTVNGGLTITVPSAARSTCSLAAPASTPKLTLSRDSGGTYTWTSTGGTAVASAVQGDLPAQESVTLEVRVKAAAILAELRNRIDDGNRITMEQIVYKPGNAFASWTAGTAPLSRLERQNLHLHTK
jgi:hypothetical protein